MVSFPLLATRETTHLVTMITFPVTGFPNWKYVAILASFLAPVKSERMYYCDCTSGIINWSDAKVCSCRSNKVQLVGFPL